MVYVLAKDGKPLMPTQRHSKVRRMLREGKAKVIRRDPFTIQLLYETDESAQSVMPDWFFEAEFSYGKTDISNQQKTKARTSCD